MRTDFRNSTYTDGTPCVIASHPDLPECAHGYGPTQSIAEERLAIARERCGANCRGENDAE